MKTTAARDFVISFYFAENPFADDDPGRFELIRSSYVFRLGDDSVEIPVIRSMGADGRVEVPYEVVFADQDRIISVIKIRNDSKIPFRR